MNIFGFVESEKSFAISNSLNFSVVNHILDKPTLLVGLHVVYIRFIRKKTSVDKPLLEYMSKKLNTR